MLMLSGVFAKLANRLSQTCVL